ncbi:MAG: cysteine desulfurase [Chloroflexi bacterium]|nr:cysteine desulfurase [Chloroflexota bacterium]
MYFDYCATTPVSEEVIAAMQPFWRIDYGNPSSLHQYGRIAAESMEHARVQVAASIGAKAHQIIFTSGATEANNLALLGILQPWQQEGAHLITSSIEHHSVLHTAQFLEKMGCEVTYLPVNKAGLISPESVEQAIRANTRLISIMLVNNELGTVQPVAAIGKIAHQHGIPFHSDAVQGIGLLDVDSERMGIDLVSLSAHKIYGPKGAGALMVRTDIAISNIFHGGSQEQYLRPGTENVPAIIGFGKACELVSMNKERDRNVISGLRKQLVENLRKRIAGLRVNGAQGTDLCPHVLSLTFPDCVAEMMQIRLSKQDVALSLGSACNSKEIMPSHVLLAIGLSREEADATIRISLGRETTQEEVARLSEILPDVASACRI